MDCNEFQDRESPSILALTPSRMLIACSVSNGNPEDRKDAHLRICLNQAVDGLTVSNGFEHFRFEHDALPELDRDAIDLTTTAFGKTLAAPIMIGAMTGGTVKAGNINAILAEAAQECGVAMALGSQRKMIEDPSLAGAFYVRDAAPDALLMGNMGAVQLNYGVTAKQIQQSIEQSGVDLFAFHLNPLQEAIQPEGDTNFSGLVQKLADVIPRLSVPVFLKEVGAGLGPKTLEKIKHLPIAGIETAGVGGTSWSKVESFRNDSWQREMTGQHLASFGTPTAESLLASVEILGAEKQIICSGGIRTGHEMAKALALGANLVATALPFLKAADAGGVEMVIMTIQQFIDELKTVMFITGSANLSELRTQPPRDIRR